ncbi:GNAT family N-acetyltransferase [Deinococcus yavapaiensis]|uniref:Acetyltransferase (GNAT) family protein n=1 Tax=Deinococcus yavapaiensis KR-236 TaxID=694435 RepID=A0A318SAQ8_9DEIO|nr:acetyltransferase (GNAT) family protein [Deinococcus yavapaiensis KR-236]
MLSDVDAYRVIRTTNDTYAGVAAFVCHVCPDEPVNPAALQAADEALRAANVPPASWVAVVGEEIVGYTRGWRVQEDRFRLRVLVAPRHRGRGIGNALLEFAE